MEVTPLCCDGRKDLVPCQGIALSATRNEEKALSDINKLRQ